MGFDLCLKLVEYFARVGVENLRVGVDDGVLDSFVSAIV